MPPLWTRIPERAAAASSDRSSFPSPLSEQKFVPRSCQDRAMGSTYRWDDLEIFLATARAGTLAGAASTLGVNSSTIHRRITDLESQLRTRLFDRSQRGYALTPVGEMLLEHAIAIEEEVLAATRKVSGRDQNLEGDVRVSTIDDIAILILPPIVKSFRAMHPGVSVQVTPEQELANLSRGQADVPCESFPSQRPTTWCRSSLARSK
jgi:DNA-binding transcriptional LysR family regulator